MPWACISSRALLKLEKFVLIYIICATGPFCVSRLCKVWQLYCILGDGKSVWATGAAFYYVCDTFQLRWLIGCS